MSGEHRPAGSGEIGRRGCGSRLWRASRGWVQDDIVGRVRTARVAPCRSHRRSGRTRKRAWWAWEHESRHGADRDRRRSDRVLRRGLRGAPNVAPGQLGWRLRFRPDRALRTRRIRRVHVRGERREDCVVAGHRVVWSCQPVMVVCYFHRCSVARCCGAVDVDNEVTRLRRAGRTGMSCGPLGHHGQRSTAW